MMTLGACTNLNHNLCKKGAERKGIIIEISASHPNQELLQGSVFHIDTVRKVTFKRQQQD
jgi:hypothetical protein